jgi:hypothetical protein
MLTGHDQKLTKGSLLAQCEPVTLVAPPKVEQPHVQDTVPKLQDVIAARPNLSDTESWELEKLTEYGDIFATKSDDYRWTDKLYHRLDSGVARPIRQPRRSSPKQKCRMWARCLRTCKGVGWWKSLTASSHPPSSSGRTVTSASAWTIWNWTMFQGKTFPTVLDWLHSGHTDWS